MIERLDKLIQTETRKAIQAILESRLSGGDDERERQERQASVVHSRGLNSSDDPEKKDEAEETEDKADKPKDKEASEDQEKREDRTKGRGTADSPKLKNPKKEQLKNPPLGSVIDKLNALRGGRSLKDPEVKKSFSQYYEGLTVPERQSLIIFLTGIAQVLAGSEPGAEAIDPGDVGLRVKKSSEQPTNIETEPTGKEGTEDNPIIVGEVASKHSIMRALREYSKYSK